MTLLECVYYDSIWRVGGKIRIDETNIMTIDKLYNIYGGKEEGHQVST